MTTVLGIETSCDETAAAVVVDAVTLNVCPTLRPLKAVPASGSRATAPPSCQLGNAVRGERICVA